MVRGSLDEVIDTSHAGTSRRDARQRKSRQRKRRRSWVAVLLTVVLLGGACYAAYAGLKPLYESFNFGAPKDYQGAGSGDVTVVIPPGASGGQIGRILEAKGVVMNASAFLKAAAADPRATSIQPGSYAMHKQMSSAAALGVLTDAQNRIVRKVTIKEGMSARGIADLLVKSAKFDKADVQAALKDSKGIGLPAAAKGNPEGYLFPSTYEFEPDTTATEALRTMVTQNQKVMDELGVPAAKQRAVLIKASIVQIEGGSEDDFGKIARVIENRLANKLGNGSKLQMDSTVSYGAGHTHVFTTDAERADPSNPYNTYAHSGLPAGPIGNPGKAAIQAVLDPPPGPWLYFMVVNLDTGETKFATTSAEHAAHNAELQKWIREHK